MGLKLPVDDFIPIIEQALKKSSAVVITAAPGAGKTTRVPYALIKSAAKKVLVLEPRRIAAIAAAYRIAEENNSEIGKEVGFEVRFDRKINKDTKLVFVTEALLTRKLLSDPMLSEFDIVVLDEFHERSLHTDLAIGLLKELQELERPDLKIVVMSATLDAQKLSEYLSGAPIVDVPGSLCALENIYDAKSQSLLWNPNVTDKMVEKIKSAVLSGEKDTLVFLPGVYEIDQVSFALAKENWAKNFEVLPLHGRLDLREQQKALKPSDRRKIILSTNVAESSVTVDGLDTVVDSGLERGTAFQMQSGFSRLTTRRISLASATQRGGRAARQFPGRCFKLWSPHDEKSMNSFGQPEIKTQDLSETVLTLAYLGVKDPKNFSWFENPTDGNLEFASSKLKNLGLVDDNGITDLGRKVVLYPLPLRLALLMENFKKENRPELGAWVCALLSERGGNSRAEIHDTDCDLIADLKKGNRFLESYRKVALQLAANSESYKWNPDDEDLLKKVLVKSFADRLGRKRNTESEKGILSTGRGVAVSKFSAAKKSTYFVVLDGTDTENSNETQVSKASGISEEFLRKYFSSSIRPESRVEWSDEKKTFLEKKYSSLFGLVIGNEHTQTAPAELIEKHLPEIAFQNWNWILQNQESLRDWWERFAFYGKHVNEEASTFWTEEKVKEVLNQVCYGNKSLKDLIDLDWVYFMEELLPQDMLQEFRKKLPSVLVAAKERRIKVHYTGEQAPYVELRIQDAFPWKKHPEVGNGIKLTVVLLAPNQRPTQVTKDLEGFWKGSYKDVRKELKARYPKHDWPEDV